MGAAGQELLDLVDEPDPFVFDLEEILPRQLKAAQEHFEQHRDKIGLLNRRAEEAGIDTIESLEDVVPLLFSHTVYKSYPQSFVTNGQWDRLLQWYDSLAGQNVGDVDVDGVETIDDFAERLVQAGWLPHVTSGTSGRVSLLHNTDGDRLRAMRIGGKTVGYPRPVGVGAGMRYYGLTPSRGYSKHVEHGHNIANSVGRPDAIRFLTDEPMLPSQVARVAEIRTRMSNGTVTPEELAAFEAEAKKRTERHAETLREMAADIIEHRHEPMVIMGLWSQHWSIMQQAREAGVGDGEFHPDSLIYTGGGLKGIPLPPDYREQLYGFYGDTRRYQAYNMSENDPTAPMCEAGRYHQPPWVMWLILDQPGEQLVEVRGGIADGRFAFLAFNYEGRWGGLISGDHVQVDYGPCPCGRSGPTVIDTVVRYSEQEGGDDKIGCAGSMEAYLRGVVQV